MDGHVPTKAIPYQKKEPKNYSNNQGGNNYQGGGYNNNRNWNNR